MPNARKAANTRRFRAGRYPLSLYLDVRIFGRLELLRLRGFQTWPELLAELTEYGFRCREQRRRKGLPPIRGTGKGPMPAPPKARPGLSESIPEAGAGAVL